METTLTNLSAAVRAEALERFRVIRPFVEEGTPLPTLMQHTTLSLRTARRWVKRYRTGGLVALCRHPRADKGSRRAVPAPLTQVVEALALQKPAPSAATVHRQVTALATAQGLRVPSYDVIHDMIRQIDPALVTLAHEGSKEYRQAFDLLYRREADAPNALWQADHTLLDMQRKDEKGQSVRPWLTVVLDDYSRAVAGYMVALEAPSALHTALALRQAIWRKPEPTWQVCGIPGILSTDHGADFTSHHLEQVCADRKIQPIFSQVGQPRGRGRVERFFKTINQELLARLPGYTPAGCASHVIPVLDLPAFTHAFTHFVLAEYHQRPHSQPFQYVPVFCTVLPPRDEDSAYLEVTAMLLDTVFAPFIKERPICVMARGVLERLLDADRVDTLFAYTATQQYTRELLFSTVVQLMSEVVLGIQPSVHAAYQAHKEEIGVSTTALYNKLDRVETTVAAALVRDAARLAAPVVQALRATHRRWVPG